MRRAYILIYNEEVGTRDQVKSYLDSLPEILNWRTELPNSFLVISESDANDIATLMRRFTHDKGRFFVCEIPANNQGWLTKKMWRMINEKHLPE